MELTDILKKRSKAVLSIECGQAFFKIAYLEPHKRKLRLIDCLVSKSSLAKDSKEDLAALINSFLKKNSIVGPQVYLTISDPDSVAIKHLELPLLPKSEIIGAARWQLKEDLSFDLEEAIIGWEIVREFIDQEQTKKNEVVFAVASAKTIDQYVSLLNQCGLTPSKVSLAPFNYGSILKHNLKDSKAQSIIDISYSETTLYMYVDAKLRFVRKIPFSSERLTKDLTGTLISDKGKVQLSYKQAEQIKQKFGMPEDQKQSLEANIGAIQLISLLRPHLEVLARELKRTFDYFSSEFNEEISHKLYLVGGGGNLKNLDSFLAKELSMEVLALPLPEAIDVGAIEQEKLDSCCLQLLSALGIILSDSTAVNLIPKEIKAQKSELIQKVSLRVVAVVAAALFLFAILVVRLQVRDYKVRLSNVQTHLETIGEIRTLRQGILARDGLITKLQKGKVPAAGVLKTLSILVPNQVILNSVTFNQDRGVLLLQGEVLASSEVAETVLTEFMQGLEGSAFFAEASLTSSRKERAVQSFKMHCDLPR